MALLRARASHRAGLLSNRFRATEPRISERYSTLTWTNDGDLFSVMSDLSGGKYLGISSQAHSGDSAVSAGTYNNVDVNAIGNWTIKINAK